MRTTERAMTLPHPWFHEKNDDGCGCLRGCTGGRGRKRRLSQGVIPGAGLTRPLVGAGGTAADEPEPETAELLAPELAVLEVAELSPRSACAVVVDTMACCAIDSSPSLTLAGCLGEMAGCSLQAVENALQADVQLAG